MPKDPVPQWIKDLIEFLQSNKIGEFMGQTPKEAAGKNESQFAGNETTPIPGAPPYPTPLPQSPLMQSQFRQAGDILGMANRPVRGNPADFMNLPPTPPPTPPPVPRLEEYFSRKRRKRDGALEGEGLKRLQEQIFKRKWTKPL